jgi:hypothetical protein
VNEGESQLQPSASVVGADVLVVGVRSVIQFAQRLAYLPCKRTLIANEAREIHIDRGFLLRLVHLTRALRFTNPSNVSGIASRNAFRIFRCAGRMNGPAGILAVPYSNHFP